MAYYSKTGKAHHKHDRHRYVADILLWDNLWRWLLFYEKDDWYIFNKKKDWKRKKYNNPDPKEMHPSRISRVYFTSPHKYEGNLYSKLKAITPRPVIKKKTHPRVEKLTSEMFASAQKHADDFELIFKTRVHGLKENSPEQNVCQVQLQLLLIHFQCWYTACENFQKTIEMVAKTVLLRQVGHYKMVKDKHSFEVIFVFMQLLKAYLGTVRQGLWTYDWSSWDDA